jgi:hypothetical protein
MGYNIYIGEACVGDIYPEDHESFAEATAWKDALAALTPAAGRELAALLLRDGPVADWLIDHGMPEGGHENYLELDVAKVELPEAPAFPGDVMSQNINARYPSYTGWSDFTRRCGLYPEWYGTDQKRGGLMDTHPGVAALDARTLAMHESALDLHRCRFPGAVAQQGDEVGPNDNDRARLEWLVWWMRWALANCTNPAVSNS